MKHLKPKAQLKKSFIKPSEKADNYGDNYQGMGHGLRKMKQIDDGRNAAAVKAQGSGPYPKEYMDGSKNYKPMVSRVAKRVMKKMGY